MSDIPLMKPAGLLRGLRRLASKRGWEFTVQDGANHSKVTLNGRQTVVPRHPKDLGTGLFRAILKQLGLSAEDLE